MQVIKALIPMDGSIPSVGGVAPIGPERIFIIERISDIRCVTSDLVTELLNQNPRFKWFAR